MPDDNLPDKDKPLGGPERPTVGPLVIVLAILAGIVLLFLAITAFSR